MLRVLVAHGDAGAAGRLVTLLSGSGHETLEAYDGLSALDLAATFLPDVVLVSLALPGGGGYGVARRLRALPGLRGVVLIALTRSDEGLDQRRAFEAGFDLHLAAAV